MEENVNTSGLLSMLQSEDGETVLHRNLISNSPVFPDTLKELMQVKKRSAAQLIVETGISKTYAYQLLRGERRPGRDVVLRISLALQLTVKETQRLLTLSGNSVLYPRLRRDAAVIFALGRRMALSETEDLLMSLAERTLFHEEV